MRLHLASLSRLLLVTTFAIPACSQSNSLTQRQSVAREIPTHIREFSPALAAPVMQVHRTTDSAGKLTGMHTENWGTAQLLPGGVMLSAGHVFPPELAPGTLPLLNLDGLMVQATILQRRDGGTIADWLLFQPVFDRGAFSPLDPPDSIQKRLANPLRVRIRFDADVFIPRGTTLYAFGFIHAPELESTESLPLTSAIIRGTTPRDLAPGDWIAFESDTPLSIKGMSGGPIALYDEHTEELVVVGVLTASHRRVSLWNSSPTRLIVGPRIPPEALIATQQ